MKMIRLELRDAVCERESRHSVGKEAIAPVSNQSVPLTQIGVAGKSRQKIRPLHLEMRGKNPEFW